jgi:hypothetical protein
LKSLLEGRVRDVSKMKVKFGKYKIKKRYIVSGVVIGSSSQSENITRK